MGFPAAFLTLMNQTVTVQDITGVSTDGYGTATYSTAKSLSARVTGTAELVRTFEGSEETATTVVWARSTSTFSPLAKWTLPDGTSPPLMRVDSVFDEDGVLHHLKAYF